jgi:hypothetical protein
MVKKGIQNQIRFLPTGKNSSEPSPPSNINYPSFLKKSLSFANYPTQHFNLSLDVNLLEGEKGLVKN